MSSDKCIHLGNHHHSQNIEHFSDVPTFVVTLLHTFYCSWYLIPFPSHTSRWFLTRAFIYHHYCIWVVFLSAPFFLLIPPLQILSSLSPLISISIFWLEPSKFLWKKTELFLRKHGDTLRCKAGLRGIHTPLPSMVLSEQTFSVSWNPKSALYYILFFRCY